MLELVKALLLYKVIVISVMVVLTFLALYLKDKYKV